MLPVLHKRVGDALLVYGVVQKKPNEIQCTTLKHMFYKKIKRVFEEYKGECLGCKFFEAKIFFVS